MTSLKIGIIEDDLIVAKTIFVTLQQIGYSPIKAVRNYTDALSMIRSESPDLLLVDIVLDGEKDGIELAATVNKQFGIPFIFLTANSDVATVSRAKLVNPYAYLVKPFYENDLFTSIEIAFSNYNRARNSPINANDTALKLSGSIFIKEGSVFHKVQLSDILYLESENVYLNVFTSKRNYVVREKLEDFVANYSKGNFVRVHRSYAVNTEHLESINDISVKVGAKEIPVNQNYRKELIAHINSLK